MLKTHLNLSECIYGTLTNGLVCIKGMKKLILFSSNIFKIIKYLGSRLNWKKVNLLSQQSCLGHYQERSLYRSPTISSNSFFLRKISDSKLFIWRNISCSKKNSDIKGGISSNTVAEMITPGSPAHRTSWVRRNWKWWQQIMIFKLSNAFKSLSHS